MPNWGGGASGAGSGALAGSAFGPWGTVIGGGLGFVKGLFSGGGDKKADAAKDDPLTITNDLDSLRQYSDEDRAQGDQYQAQSSPAIASSLNYLNDLAKGDQSAVLGATRAQRGRIIDQYDSGRRAAAQFGPRGGGLDQAIGQSYITQSNQLSDITSEAQTAAATQLGTFGAQLAGLGLSADQLANADIGTVLEAVLNQQKIDATKRGQNMELWGGVGKTAGNVLGEILLKKYGGGGAS